MLGNHDDHHHHDADGDDDCGESNVDSPPGKVQASQMWGHFCCAMHTPRSRHDDHVADDDFDIILDEFADDDFDILLVELQMESCGW